MDVPDRKNEILKAATACFSRYGYEKTTLDDIGRLVGLNKASLYHYFKNKEDIYTEVIYTEATEFKNGIMPGINKASGYKEKITAYLIGRLNYIKGAVYFNQLSNDSLQRIAPLFSSMYNRLLQEEIGMLSDILKLSIRSGEISPCDTDRVAKSILTVAEAIRNKIDTCVASDEAYQDTLNEIQFTVSLILGGLAQNERA